MSGAFGEIECPYCKYIAHNDFDAKQGNGWKYGGKEYKMKKFCPICGWTKYGDDKYDNPVINLLPKPIVIARIISKVDKESDTMMAVESFIAEEYENSKVHTYRKFISGLIDYIFE